LKTVELFIGPALLQKAAPLASHSCTPATRSA